MFIDAGCGAWITVYLKGMFLSKRKGRNVFFYELCQSHSLVSLGQLLHLVGFSLSRSLHSGDELLVSTLDLLLLNGNLLLPLHHLDFNLLQSDLLLLFSCLQLVRQLSLCFLKWHKVLFIL